MNKKGVSMSNNYEEQIYIDGDYIVIDTGYYDSRYFANQGFYGHPGDIVRQVTRISIESYISGEYGNEVWVDGYRDKINKVIEENKNGRKNIQHVH